MTFMKQFKPHRCLKTDNLNWHFNSSNKGNFFDPYIIASIQSLKAKTILTNTIVQIAPATVSLLNLFLILMLNRLQLIWISSISEVYVSSKTYVFMKFISVVFMYDCILNMLATNLIGRYGYFVSFIVTSIIIYANNSCFPLY